MYVLQDDYLNPTDFARTMNSLVPYELAGQAALAAVNHVCLRIAYMRVLVLRECVSCVVGSIQTLTC